MLLLDGNSLTLENVYDVVYNFTKVGIAEEAKKRMQESRDVVDAWVKKGETIYGVTTGFGDLSTVTIPTSQIEELQENLIVSHAVGTGDLLPPAIVRAMLLLRANALAKGFSGIRIWTVDFLLRLLNENILPAIPSQGSVGSSGDLAPLAHLVLAAIGKGRFWKFLQNGAATRVRLDSINHETIPADELLKEKGIAPLRLHAKEGIALINGTQMMSAFGALEVYQARQLAMTADICAALSIEALKGTDKAFDARLHATRPHVGQQRVAENMRTLLRGSEIRESHRHNDPRVQDAYSLRCVPQVHGASRDAIEYAAKVLETEINSATDNPLIFAKEGEHIEGGNFHGQPLALALDFLAIALSELANISERRTERLVNGSLSGLPKFLTEHGGLNSGMMIAQYTAASLVSENKVLAHPASVDSIPTSANQEDHNSMGSIAARKCYTVLQNLRGVLAIELLCAAQAIDFHRPLKCGAGTQAAYTFIRSYIPHLEKDRVLYDDIQKMISALTSDAMLAVVGAVTKIG
jgi:histidine ammonia-lyase